MENRYESIVYSDEDKEILKSTILSADENQILIDIRQRCKRKIYYSVIEDLYKFYKNEYSTTELAEIYEVTPRQIQRMFKDMGINRDRIEAQQIAVNKRDYTEIRKTYKKTMLSRLTDTQLSGSLLEQYVRHEIDLLLGGALPHCEIIVGINSMNIIGSESDIPIIIINNSYLYKYIIEVDGSPSHKLDSGKKRDKIKETKAHYKGYTLYRINTKAYFDSQNEPKLKYENEVSIKLKEIVEIITSEVSGNISNKRLK